ncbi:Hpt domain-containing protein [Planctomicrobium piriforme]|uniref:Hpt domain-containing protein n=1 Tax=Planctomicrobium piriforme TaxID=1576369 RepID=A0A1I3H2D1_9PLAN|nr:Hpt domain-containing protein [Planctomicrobium piriforme]SFI29915.1 Hpt domain-containing protein [Planctomicrobium piriforme]
MSAEHLQHVACHDDLLAVVAEPSLDLPQLLARCLGNLALANRLIQALQGSVTQLQQQLQQAVANSDLAQTALLAHRLRGEAANLGAARIRDAAAQLESAGRSGDLSLVRETFTTLETACRHFLSQPLPEAAASDVGQSLTRTLQNRGRLLR